MAVTCANTNGIAFSRNANGVRGSRTPLALRIPGIREMASSLMKLTLIIAAAHALTSAVAMGWAMFAYEQFFTGTEVAALVPLALTAAITVPCLLWLCLAWLANCFSRRALATVTFILGLLVCALGCILIVKSTTVGGIDGQGIDVWWPLHV